MLYDNTVSGQTQPQFFKDGLHKWNTMRHDNKALPSSKAFAEKEAMQAVGNHRPFSFF
jgi:hypothetical protein